MDREERQQRVGSSWGWENYQVSQAEDVREDLVTAGTWWGRTLDAWIKWSWICNNQEEEQQGNWDPEAEAGEGRKRKRRGSNGDKSRNVFEHLDTHIRVLELAFIPAWTFLYCWANSCETWRQSVLYFACGRPAHARESCFLVLLSSPLLKMGELCATGPSLLPALGVAVWFVDLLLFSLPFWSL